MDVQGKRNAEISGIAEMKAYIQQSCMLSVRETELHLNPVMFSYIYPVRNRMTGGSAALKDCQEKEVRHEALKVSIMGDSISTFEGCNPLENKVFYQGLTARKNGVFSKELTWWHLVIEGLHAQLCINNAYSGSKVSGKGFPSALSPERIEGLSGRMEPDVILVYMGLNDFGKNVFVGKSRRILWKKNPEHFFDAYCLMLQRMKKRYPKAKVI